MSSPVDQVLSAEKVKEQFQKATVEALGINAFVRDLEELKRSNQLQAAKLKEYEERLKVLVEGLGLGR